MNRTIALFSDTGGGKTTQIGVLAKALFKQTGQRTLLNSADRGGCKSVSHLIKLGVIQLNEFGEGDNPWTWINGIVSSPIPDGIGLIANDSATSMGEILLADCARQAADGIEIGGRPAPKFTVNKGSKDALRIGSNVDSHYQVVQNHMLEKIWKSTWMARKGPDIIWTFSIARGEGADAGTILGPKLPGKALTAAIPKWFDYTFMLDDVEGKHTLYLRSHLEGIGKAPSNSRIPLSVFNAMPPSIEPADLARALEMIDEAYREAEEKDKEELGL